MTKIIPKQKFDSSIKSIAAVVPRVMISTLALTKMKLYIDNCSDEVGWFFTAHKIESDKIKTPLYLINDAFLFEQKVHATTTEVNEELLSKFGEEILSYDDGMQIWNSLCGWGHSHVNMGVTPSGQDDTQMEFFKKSGFPFFFRIIGNKKGEFKVDIYNYEIGVSYHDVPWQELMTDEMRKKKDEIDEIENEAAIKIEAIEKEIDEIYKSFEKTQNDIIKEEVKVKVGKFTYAKYQYERDDAPLYNSFYERGGNVHGTGYKDSLKKEEKKTQEQEKKITNQKIATITNLVDVFTDAEIQLLATMPNVISLKQNMPERLKGITFTEKDYASIFSLSKFYMFGGTR